MPFGSRWFIHLAYRKGTRLIFLGQGVGFAATPRGVSRRQTEVRHALSLHVNSLQSLESVYPEIGIDGWQSARLFRASGALRMALENARPS